MSKTTLGLIAAACAAAGLGSTAVAPLATASRGAHEHRHVHGEDRRSSALTPRQTAHARAAVDLLRGSFTLRQPRKYAEKYIDATTYIQHDPTFADGREAFISGVEGFLAQSPGLQRPLVRTIAQGDLVVVEGSVKTGPSDPGTVIDDTFRFNAAGKIVEHWDAIQPVAATSKNGHPQV